MHSKIINVGLVLLILSLAFGWQTKYAIPAGIIGIFVSILFILYIWDKRKEHNFRLTWLDLSLALFFVISLILSIWSIYFNSSLIEWIRLFIYVEVFWLISFWFRKERLEIFVLLIVFVGILVSLYGLYQLFLMGGGNYQITSTFGIRNTFGGFLLLILPISLSLFLATKNFRELRFFGLASLLMGINLILTYSRASWLILLIILLGLVFILIKRSNFKQLLLRLFILSFAVALAVSVLTRFGPIIGTQTLSSRLGSISKIAEDESGSGFSRTVIWKAAVKIGMARPLTGTGLSNYQYLIPQYQQKFYFFAKDPHNYILKIFAELGWIGLLVFGFIAYHIFMLIYRSVYSVHYQNEEFLVVLGLSGGILGSILHNLVDFDFWIPAVFLLFFIELGLIRSISGLDNHYVKFDLGKSFNFVMALVVIIVFINLGFILGDYYLSKGDKEFRQNKFEQALFDFQTSRKFNPLDMITDQRIAISYNRLKNTDQAIVSIKSAISKNKTYGYNHNTLGNLYLINNDKHKADLVGAEKELKLAIQYDPLNKPEYYRDLGKYYLTQNNTEEAKKYLLDTLRIFPESEVARVYADTFIALNFYQPLLQTRLQLAEIYQKEGNEDKSRLEQDKATELKDKIEKIQEELL